MLDLLEAIAANPASSLAEPETALLSLPPEVERHLALAQHIQSAFGAGLSGQAWLGEVLDRIASPALAFDAAGAILLMNGASLGTPMDRLACGADCSGAGVGARCTAFA